MILRGSPSKKLPLGISLRNGCSLPGYNNSDIHPRAVNDDHNKPKKEAYMTLVSSEKSSGENGLSYVDAAIVLIHGLRRFGSTKEVIVLAGDELSERSLKRLEGAGRVSRETGGINSNENEVRVIRVKNIQPPVKPGDNILRMRHSFSKLWGWTLEEYSKIVYLDADHLVLGNVDELFDQPELSATPELELPHISFGSLEWLHDIYTSWFGMGPTPLEVLHKRPRSEQVFQCGMFVLEPHNERFEELRREKERSSDYPRFGVDTGFMNCYFRDAWKPLPFGLNAQHFCNSSPTGLKCEAFLRLWKTHPEAVKTVHDKFFLYDEEANEMNRLWYQQYREATINDDDYSDYNDELPPDSDSTETE